MCYIGYNLVFQSLTIFYTYCPNLKFFGEKIPKEIYLRNDFPEIRDMRYEIRDMRSFSWIILIFMDYFHFHGLLSFSWIILIFMDYSHFHSFPWIIVIFMDYSHFHGLFSFSFPLRRYTKYILKGL